MIWRVDYVLPYVCISGDQIIEVNGTHLRGMDQEDVIKIFRDLPGSTEMKIRRSRTAPRELDSAQKTEKRKESLEKPPAQEPVPLPKPPENKRRSSLRNKVQPVKQGKQEDKPASTVTMDGVSSSEYTKPKTEKDSSQIKGFVSSELNQNKVKVADKTEERIKSSDGKQNGPESHREKPTSDNKNTSMEVTNTKSVKIKDELGDNLIIPTGHRKMTVSIKKTSNSTLGISLVPSYGKLKGYFQVMAVLKLVCCKFNFGKCSNRYYFKFCFCLRFIVIIVNNRKQI